MNERFALLQRIGEDGRKDLLQKWLNGQKNLVADYNNGPRHVPKDQFIYNLVKNFFSAYKCEVWQHLLTIDMCAREQFEIQYVELLATVN